MFLWEGEVLERDQCFNWTFEQDGRILLNVLKIYVNDTL